MDSKAFISGFSGLELTDDETRFFADERPWGYIVFARNIETPGQLSELCASLRSVSGREDVPILIDQEGGRVQRLRPPHWTNYPPAAQLGALYEIDQAKGLRAAWLLSRLHAFDLLNCGVNVDCLPVLDVPVPGGHDVIGDRAYGTTPEQVSAMGRAASDGLLAGGVKPVIKHIPGHGRAGVDSHLELPVVETDRETLMAQDFAPFGALRDVDMAMTAHVIYTAYDSANPATTSKIMIDEIIRGHIGFDGLLMSDDVSMEALSGDFSSRTRAIFGAGCDIVLHCNGIFEQMQTVARETPELTGKAAERAQQALQSIGKADDADEAACRAEFDSLMRLVAVSV